MTWRRAAALALAVAVSILGTATPLHATAEVDERDLAERFAPVLVVRTQTQPCGEGEPYLPMAVDDLFGQGAVTLRGPGGEVITNPTLDDLTGLGPEWHVDIQGNALRPGCTYEQLYDRLDATPTVYARVTIDDDHVVLQYWMFFLYNDWNDRHEGDWEMIQLVFDTDDVAMALTMTPSSVAYAQHEGSQRSAWDDGAVQVVDGTHPLVFVGEGSHASYFRSDRWFGKSAQSGFGCDNTSAPTSEVTPALVHIDNDSLPAWLTFEGRWGERQRSFNNGPTGPNDKTQWDEPVRWLEDEGRFGAVALPADGSQVTDFFCAATERVTSALFRLMDNPWVVGGLLLAVIAALTFAARRTRWGPVQLDPIAGRRRGGQIIRTALRAVRRRPLLFATLGSLLPAAGVLASIGQGLYLRVASLGGLADVAGRDSVFGGLVVSAIGAAIVLPATVFVFAASIEAVRSYNDDDATARRTLLRTWEHVPALLLYLVVTATLVLSLISVILVPVALWWIARSAVAVPSAMDGHRPWSHSAELTRGHRWRALGLSAVALVIGGLVPPLIGTLALIITDASFAVVNLIAGVVGLFAVPLAGAISCLQYLDLTARARSDAPVDVTA